MKKSRYHMLLNFVFIIGIVISYYNGMSSDMFSFPSEPKTECSSNSISLNSDFDFNEDDHVNPISNIYFFSSHYIYPLEYNGNNLIIESMLSHWQPPKA